MANKANIKFIAIVGVIVMISTLVVATWIGVQQSNQTSSTRNFVLRMHDTLEKVDHLLSVVKDAETGQRGFIITGQERYLEPYNDALAKVEPAVTALKESFSDNPEQLKRVDELEPLVHEKIDELQRSVALRRSQGFDAARALVLTHYGNEKMRSVRAIIHDIKEHERNLLTVRTASLMEQAQRSGPMLLMLLGLAVTALLTTAAAMMRFLTEKQRAQDLAADVARQANRAKNSLDAVLANMADGLYQLDLNGALVFINEAGEQMLGYKMDELKGKNIHDQIHYRMPGGEKRPAEDCQLMGVMKTGITYRDVDDFFIAKDGTAVPVRYSSSPQILDEKIVGAVLSFTDMTERLESERQLQVSHSITAILAVADSIDEALQNILRVFCDRLEWSFGAFWRPISSSEIKCICHCLNTTSDISVFVNASLNSVFAPGQGLPGRVWQLQRASFIADVNLDTGLPRLQAAREGSLTSALAFPVIFEDRFLGVLEFASETMKTHDRSLDEVLRNISGQIGLFLERKNAEAELLLTQERYNLAIQGAHDGIWDWDLVTNQCYYSPTAKMLLGLAEDESPEAPDVIASIIHPDDRDRLNAAVKAHVEDFQPYDIEMRALSQDGSFRWLHALGQAVRDHDGRAIRMAGSLRDISDRKEAERRVNEFYSSVSHELRTPLTSIRGSLSLIEAGRAGELPAKVAQLVKIARAESERLVRLINDILDIKKIEAGKLELRLSINKPSVLVESCLSALRPASDAAEVTVNVEIGADEEIMCDADRCQQVLTNLLSNAIKYSPKGGCVTVTTSECERQRLRFSIKDEGPGIPASQLHKLFGLFQQLDSSDTRQKGGTGLGLAISKAIVEQHGGNIGVDTTPGAGSTFWFDLPASRLVQRRSESNEKLRYRALLIEDDQNLTVYLKFLLAEHGFAVSQAGTLAEATKFLSEEMPPDIILLDIQLPDGNGLEIFETLHGLEKIPVVVVSGTDPGAGDISNVFEWIKKPFAEHQLVAALRLCMRDRGLGAARVLIIEDDRATRELLKSQLEGLGVECLEAEDGETGLAMLRSVDPDLIILDVGIPAPDGFAIVDQLKSEGRETSPMIIYTAQDLSREEKTRLRLGLTAYITKSQTSETQFMQVVKELLNGLITNIPPANTEERDR